MDKSQYKQAVKFFGLTASQVGEKYMEDVYRAGDGKMSVAKLMEKVMIDLYKAASRA